MEYWAEHPPAHIILAAVHFKPQKQRGDKQPGAMRDELKSEVVKLGLGETRTKLPEMYRRKK